MKEGPRRLISPKSGHQDPPVRSLRCRGDAHLARTAPTSPGVSGPKTGDGLATAAEGTPPVRAAVRDGWIPRVRCRTGMAAGMVDESGSRAR